MLTKTTKWIFFDVGTTLVDETEAYNHRIRDAIEGTDITFEQFQEKRIFFAKQNLKGDLEAIKYFGLEMGKSFRVEGDVLGGTRLFLQEVRIFMKWLENKRIFNEDSVNAIPIWKQVIYSACVMAFGIILGCVSKYLDCTPSNYLPYIMERLDIRNFLGRFAIWIFIAVCISVYSKSALRAAVNVFVFFVGMVGSYYLYSKFIAGFFPKSYAMIWIGFTILSPFLAFICWYAKGGNNRKLSLAVSAAIIAVLFNTAFAYGIWYFDIRLWYFDVRYVPELIIFLLSIFLLRRNAKEMVIMVVVGVILAILMDRISPVHFW